MKMKRYEILYLFTVITFKFIIITVITFKFILFFLYVFQLRDVPMEIEEDSEPVEDVYDQDTIVDVEVSYYIFYI